MSIKSVWGFLLLGVFSVGFVKPAHAQFAVIDVASIVQLVQQVEQLEQQVQTAKSQLAQAQSEYAAITGGRGMQLLLGGTVRNYLPTDWTQIGQILGGGTGGFPTLSGNYKALVSANA